MDSAPYASDAAHHSEAHCDIVISTKDAIHVRVRSKRITLAVSPDG